MSHPGRVIEQSQPKGDRGELAIAMIAVACAAVAMFMRTALTVASLSAALPFFVLVAGGYLLLGASLVRQAVRSRATRLGARAGLFIGPVVLLVATVAYAAAAGLPVGPRLAIWTPYLLLPPLLLIGALTPEGKFPAAEVAVAAALWLPIEWRLLPVLPLPAPDGYDVRKLVGLVEGMYLFLVARPLPGIGYTYRLSLGDVRRAGTAFLVYAVIALPVGFASGFLAWHPAAGAVRAALSPVVIFLVVGIPEEFLFRGLFQNLLTRWVGIRAALPVASVVFGLAHLPDVRYALLAAVAGIAYGWVYWRSGKITASAVTHALVDAVWGALLGG